MKRTRTLESDNEGPAQKRKDSGNSNSNKDNKFSFPVFPHSRYDAAFPNFSEPREVGQFSLDASEDGERNVYNDSRKLKFYIPKDDKKVNFDLRRGYEKFIRKDDDIKERLDNLLRWVLMNKEQFTANEDGSIKRFVTVRMNYCSIVGHSRLLVGKVYLLISAYLAFENILPS